MRLPAKISPRAILAAVGAWTVACLTLGPSPGPVPVSGSGWHLQGNPIELHTGVRYRGCVRVSGILSLVATVDRVVSKAVALGFESVLVVASTAPSGWPTGTTCDYFVEGTWSKAATTLARPGVVPISWEAT